MNAEWLSVERVGELFQSKKPPHRCRWERGIGVPSAYCDRDLCLIVYASPSLSAVLTTHHI